jgi:hypothetical protein
MLKDKPCSDNPLIEDDLKERIHDVMSLVSPAKICRAMNFFVLGVTCVYETKETIFSKYFKCGE